MTIKFLATTNKALVPTPVRNTDAVASPKDMVQRTKAYQTCYGGENQGFPIAPRTKTDNEDEKTPPPPEVLTVKGSGGNCFSANQGLVGTISQAYNHHHNLQLRPDDIWVTILTQFCAYVNGRAEALRDKFVAHEGKKELEVTAGGTLETADFGWFTRAMLDEIAKHLKDPTLGDWFVPGFSTTTRTDEVCAAATAMCSFQQYFEYKFSLLCGIPAVTLLGSVEDWERLRFKIDRLAIYDTPDDKVLSEEWVPLLRTICDNFVESAKNGSTNNLEFWGTIVSHEGGGSGPSYISGWVSVFTFFDKDGKVIAKQQEQRHLVVGPSTEPRFKWPLVDTNDINPGVVSCPVKIDDNGKNYNSRLFVGQMAFDMKDESEGDAPRRQQLIPRNDWVLVVEKPCFQNSCLSFL